MQQVQSFLRTNPQTLTYPLNDLLQDYTRNLVFTVGGLYFSIHFFVAATWPQLFGWRLWAISIVMLLTCIVVLRTVPRSLITAHVAWQAGLGSAITLGVYVLNEPGIACLYMLLPFSATVILHLKGGILTGMVVTAAVIWLAGIMGQAAFSGSFLIAILMGGAMSVILGWAVMHVMIKVAYWSHYSVTEAQKKLEEAREHRAQVFELSRQLDQAYHHLEHTNAALIAYWQEATAAKEAKSQFVAHVSHELRTPLNLIAGFSEMMLLSPESYGHTLLPGPYRSDVNSIYRSAQHLLALIDDVIDLERIDIGRISVDLDCVEVSSLIGETVELLQSYIEAKGLYLRVRIDESLPDVRIDRLRIRQVLLNLMTNAARFTAHGGIQVEVSRQSDMLLFQVIDTGQGISEAELPHIFDEFFSRDQPASKWHSGSGLGLPISRKLVEMHQGRMGVKSNPHVGTAFWFTLPITEEPAASSHRPVPVLPLAGARTRTPRKSLVVAHSEGPVLALLRRHLTDYQITMEADFAKACVLAHRLHASALLVDETEPLPDAPSAVPIIRCRLPTRREMAATMGAVDVLTKPVSQVELLSAIDSLTLPPKRVLIVDDDPEVVRLFRRIVQTRSPAPVCFEAYNGAEAADLISKEQPDLILLDLMMPEFDGYGLLAQMVDCPKACKARVIVISGSTEELLETHLPRSFALHRRDGFETGELLRLLEAMLNGLAPVTSLPAGQVAPAG